LKKVLATLLGIFSDRDIVPLFTLLVTPLYEILQVFCSHMNSRL